MRVSVRHQTDTGEIDSEGFSDFHYVYNIYSFEEESVVLVARSYEDEPEEAHFLRIEMYGDQRLIQRSDLESSLFTIAIEYLRKHGKSQFRWLDQESENGYSNVPP